MATPMRGLNVYISDIRASQCEGIETHGEASRGRDPSSTVLQAEQWDRGDNGTGGTVGQSDSRTVGQSDSRTMGHR